MLSVGVSLSVSSSVLSVVVSTLYKKYFPCTIDYILYGQTMRIIQQLLTLFTSLILVLLLLLIVIYNCVGMYDGMGWHVGR